MAAFMSYFSSKKDPVAELKKVWTSFNEYYKKLM